MIQFKFDNLNNKIENIFHSTNFDIFQKHEKKYNFREDSKHSNFFRKGEVNEWKNILNNTQTNYIEKSFETQIFSGWIMNSEKNII